VAKFKVTKNKIKPSLGKITVKLNAMPSEAYEYWKSITPIRSGNARRRTRLQGTKIKANYNYAVPLDDGYSRQAPDGMSKPTEKFIEKLAKKAIRK
tara:strand:- start:2219 stop:2506 length:288 start_codon:yes stop_codon:yes gene_type:complete